MQKSRKKFWIVFSVICASIVALLSVMVLATRLKTVAVTFESRLAQNETMLESGIQDKILKNGEFDYGKTVLFMNFDENIDKIEKLNPFVKVEDVETIFPNKAKVKISERIPVYRVQDSKDAFKWYVLDKDFKVLHEIEGNVKDEVYSNTTYYAKTMEISPELLTIDSETGDFVTNKNTIKNRLNQIASGVEVVVDSVSIVSSLSVSGSDKNVYTLTMKNSGLNDDNGCQIVVSGNSDLYKKVCAGILCYRTNAEIKNDDELANQVITIHESSSSEIGYVGLMSPKS